MVFSCNTKNRDSYLRVHTTAHVVIFRFHMFIIFNRNIFIFLLASTCWCSRMWIHGLLTKKGSWCQNSRYGRFAWHITGNPIIFTYFYTAIGDRKIFWKRNMNLFSFFGITNKNTLTLQFCSRNQAYASWNCWHEHRDMNTFSALKRILNLKKS